MPAESKDAPVPIVYDLTKLNLADYLPIGLPPGAGGTPGSGSSAGLVARGTSSQDPRVTIISNPPKPDNNRQTVVQPASPADLKMPTETRLPNLIVVNVMPAPPAKPKPESSMAGLKVMLPEKFRASLAAPLAAPTLAVLTIVPSDRAPQLEARVVLPSSAPPPQPSNPGRPTSTAAPLPQALNPRSAPNASSAIVPSVHPPETATRSDSAVQLPNRDRLTSLSIDPVRMQDLMTLLPGNRQGAFSITPLDARPGSPGGLLAGAMAGGKNNSGAGGDASVAVGTENSGGGGPKASASAVASINGDAPAPNAAGGSLPPLLERLIYPVNTAALGFRRSGLIVSAGPGGGGGLPVFGVLHGRRIYTIYLAMPGKNWILQFCAANDYHPATLSSQTIEIHMEAPLVPPTAIDQYDFHRPPVQGDDAGRMIILRGVIRQDGSVGDLQVLQAVAQPSDQAATAAFGRWKFTPALRAGNPVPVEVLVGIPAVEPGAQ